MSLEGKVVLVTGAATGIGAAVAAGFSAQAAHVCGLDVAWQALDTDDKSLERMDCDVADEEMVRSCVTDIEARHGAVDVLVNNAALSGAVEPGTSGSRSSPTTRWRRSCARKRSCRRCASAGTAES